MSKINWSIIVVSNPAPSFFASAVSSSLPGGPRLDRNGKKLPTPYGLFEQWARNNLNGNWSTMKIRGGFYVAVSDLNDCQLISNRFGVGGPFRNKIGKSTPLLLKYSNGNYAPLAASLGYVV